MAAHAHLKNEFTEDEKYHNLMSWLISQVSDEDAHVIRPVKKMRQVFDSLVIIQE